MKIISSKKKQMNLLTNEQQKSYEISHICYICKKQFEGKYGKDEKYSKVRDNCHYIGDVLYITYVI